MIYNFRTVIDDQQYVIDTENLTWARTSSLVSAPSVTAASQNLGAFSALEEGKLAPLGGGRYAFVGRKPVDSAGKEQLAIIVLAHVPITDEDGQIVLVNLIQANVDIKDGKHSDIARFKTQCLPAIRPQKPNAQIIQPPITKEEQDAANAEQEISEIAESAN